LTTDATNGVPITIPADGVGMTEAVLVAWLQEPDAAVEPGDPIAEIETDKSTIVLQSPAAGFLSRHEVAVGAVVEVGGVIARILMSKEDAPEPPTPAEPTTTPLEPDRVRVSEPVAVADDGGRLRHRLSPRARRAQQEQGEQGETGRGRAERVRDVIAQRVTQSWREIPHFTVTSEVDAEPIVARFEALRAAEPKATFTDVLLRLLAEAVNVEGTTVDLGLAVASDAGVMIVMVENVLSLDDVALTDARMSAVRRAREGRLNAADLTGTPAATLSNLGVANVDLFTGIIPFGQRLLVTVGRIRPRAVVDGGGAVVARPTMFVTVNADHRSLDGLEAAQILDRFVGATTRGGG
jgi:pyruvate dehydrogenase E2 component (dihydrolipoamide acetyltransferase)